MQASIRPGSKFRPGSTSRSGLPMTLRTLSAFLVAVIAVVVIAALSYTSLQSSAASARSLNRAVEVIAQLQTVLSTVKDAETGQRGYLLTGRESYLEPHTEARGALP